MATFEDFLKLDIRAGEIVWAEEFEKPDALPINLGGFWKS